MKAFGGTVLVPAAPRAHLGYLAATVTRPEITLFSGGAMAAVLGAVLLVKGTAHGSRPARPRRMNQGLLALGVAAVLLLAAYLAGREEYRRPETLTWFREKVLLWALEERLVQGESFDVAAAALKESDGDPPGQGRDAWGTPIRLTRIAIDGRDAVEASSPGADRRYGTPDDIVLRWKIAPDGRLDREEGPIDPGRSLR